MKNSPKLIYISIALSYHYRSQHRVRWNCLRHWVHRKVWIRESLSFNGAAKVFRYPCSLELRKGDLDNCSIYEIAFLRTRDSDRDPGRRMLKFTLLSLGADIVAITKSLYPWEWIALDPRNSSMSIVWALWAVVVWLQNCSKWDKFPSRIILLEILLSEWEWMVAFRYLWYENFFAWG